MAGPSEGNKDLCYQANYEFSIGRYYSYNIYTLDIQSLLAAEVEHYKIRMSVRGEFLYFFLLKILLCSNQEGTQFMSSRRRAS